MSNTYLLELGCEEIPARFMPGLLKELSEKIEKRLVSERLSFTSIETKGTYRRIVLVLKGLPSVQAAEVLEIKGPPLRIAKSPDGKFLPAALGFSKKVGMDVNDLDVKELNGESYLFASKKEAEKSVESLLATIIPETLMALKQPVGMRWGRETKTFIRPIHWIVSLLNNQVIPFSFFGIESGNTSFGHRFLTKNATDATSGIEFEVESIDSFEEQLKSRFVLLNQDARRQIIKDAVNKYDGDCVGNKALLEEVTYLVEWPTPMRGLINESYLTLPHDVVIECMTKHQKYFPSFKNSVLQPSFILIADNVTNANKDRILEDNQHVLTARLDDVAFFWKEDAKKPLMD
ncbi:glycine--tRNA ligase subunit beta, partial [bacterium]|nr:glycine--tRNA ligase subunit beta [bacterium]